jgi:hypothetical protein
MKMYSIILLKSFETFMDGIDENMLLCESMEFSDQILLLL